jgi:hypothetical protein
LTIVDPDLGHRVGVVGLSQQNIQVTVKVEIAQGDAFDVLRKESQSGSGWPSCRK